MTSPGRAGRNAHEWIRFRTLGAAARRDGRPRRAGHGRRCRLAGRAAATTSRSVSPAPDPRRRPTPVGRDSIFRISSMTKPIVGGRRAHPRRGVPAAARRSRRRPAARAGRPARARRRRAVRSTATPCPRSARSPCTTCSRSGSASAWTSRHRGRSRCSTRWPSSGSAPVRPSRRCRRRPTSGCAGWRRCRSCTNPASGGSTTPGPTCSACSSPAPPANRSTSFLRERVFEPLGMVDTGFSVADVDRFGTLLHDGPGDRRRVVFDPPDGQWAKPPGVPVWRRRSGVDGRRPARVRVDAAGGRPAARRLAAAVAVRRSSAMTTDQIGVAAGRPGRRPTARRAGASASACRCAAPGSAPRSAATAGPAASGSSWSNDPAERLVGVVLTTDAFAGPFPPPAVIQDFWTGVYAAIDD